MKKIYSGILFFAFLMPLFVMAQPGSTCANPIVVNSFPFSDIGQNTSGFGDDYSTSPCNSSYMGGDDIVYELNFSTATDVIINITNITASWMGVHLLDGCPDSSPSSVSCSTSSSTANRTITANLAANQTYYLIISTWPSPQSVGFDLEILDCAGAVQNVSTTSTTNSSIDITWTAGIAGNTFQLAYGLPGNVGAPQALSTGAFSASGLNAGSTYEFQITEVCSNGSLGSTVIYTASTLCPASFTAPYSTSFEASGVGDPCWTQSTVDDFNWSFGSSTPTGSTGPSSAFDGNQFAYTESSGNSGEEGILISPEIDLSGLTNNPTVSFNYHMFGTQMGSLDLEVESPSGSGNWVLVWSDLGNLGNEWNQAIVPLTPFAGQTVKFRFYGTPGGTTTSDMAVDNFSVDNEFCVTPFDVVVSPQGLFADLSWTTLNADSVSIEYGTAGFAQGTGTVISGLTSSNFRIFGLTELTNYEAYITAYCSSTGGTATTQVIAFSTPIACNIQTNGSTASVDVDEATIQWTDPGSATQWDIEYGPAGFIQGTGTVIVGATSNPYTIPGLSAGTTYDWLVRADCGLNGVSAWSSRFTFQTVALINCSSTSFTDGGGASGNYSNNAFEVTVVEPNIPGSQLVLTFNSFSTESCCDDLTIYDGVGTSGTVLGNYAGTNSPGVIATTTPITIVFDSDGSVVSSGFQADVTCVTCFSPSNIAATGTGTSTADVTWDAPSSLTGTYDVQYGAVGFDPNQNQGTTVTGITTESTTLTGLAHSTTFDVYVRQNCGGGDVSGWIGASQFTTDFSCPAGQGLSTITIALSAYPGETSWELLDSQSNIIASGAGVSETVEVCLIDGETYTFYAFDSYGDGWNGGTYTITCISGTVIANNGGQTPNNGIGGSNDTESVESFTVNTACITTPPPPPPFCSVGAVSTFPALENFDAESNCTGASSTCSFNSTLWPTTTGLTFNVDNLTTGSGGSGLTGPSDDITGGGKYVYLETSSPISSNGGTATLESACFDLSSLTAPAISFWWNLNGANIGSLHLEVTTDGTTWTELWSISGNQGNQWNQEIIDLSAYSSTNCKLRFVGTHQPSSFYGDMAFDEIRIGEAPCPTPTNASIVATTGTSVSVQWDINSVVVTYDVSVWNAGDDPLVDAPVSSQTGITGNTATLTGLSSQTSYDVYVQSTCSDGGTGNTSALNFQTPCAVFVAPFTENFDGPTWGSLNTYDPCWQVLPDLNNPNWEVDFNTTGSSSTGPSGDLSGTGNYLFVETSGGSVGDEAYLVMPQIDISALTNPGVSFFYHMYGSTMGTLQVQARNAGSSAWTTIWSLSGQQQGDELDPWLPASADLGAFSSIVEIRFTMIHDVGGCCASDMAIDEVSVANVCPSPSNITFDNVYDTSIDVAWTGSASSYTVEIQPAGTPATGAGTSVSGTSTTLTGLTASTDYVVYVYSECGFATSAAASAAVTSGYCPAPVAIPFSALPYTEGFDVLAAPLIPCGWLVEDANTDAIEWETQDRASLSQSNPNALEITRNANADMDDWIFSPEFVVPANTSLDITFNYRVRSNQYVEKLEVFIGDGQTPADMNLQIFNVSNLQNSFYKEITVSYTTTAAENIFIGLHGYSDANEFALYIDDFEVKEADCPTPFLLTATATGQTTADLSWNGPGNNFQVEYGPAGFSPGTGTTVTATSSPYSLTGLEVGADYEFYVTNNCSATGDGNSQKAGPAVFTTDCPSVSASSTESCLDGTEITLTGVPAGGSFSGPGVSAGKFDPTSVQPGTYQISYRVTNAFGQSCAGTVDITVNPFPNVTMGDLGTFCTNQNGVTMTQGSPSGGTYSGPGVVGNQFIPSLVGQAGDYVVHYTYTNPNTGCTAVDSGSVTLVPVPNVSLGSIPSFCGPNHPAITLNGLPTGGVYSGPGVSGNTFDPSVAGVGTHTIRYTVTAGGCATSAQRTVTISEVPSVTLSPDITILYGTSTSLSAQATGGSGNYTFQWSPADSLLGNGTGTNVTTQNLTTPNDFVVRVTDNVSGCIVSDTVRVGIFGGPLQVFLSVSKDTICVGEQVELSAEVIGGSDTSYSFLWTPSTFVTDLYNDTTYSSPTQTTTYSFYVNDAFSQKVEHITVYVNNLPNVSFAPIANPCVSEADFMLAQGSPAGGTYSGPGVTGGMFSPAAAGVGTHILTYTYENAGGCESSAQRSITVSPLPTVSAAALNNVCVNSSAFALSVGAPIGGTYSGTGVSNGMFYPATAGVGTHTITYSLTNANGCASTATTTITVDPAVTASMAALADACRNGGPVTLSGGTPAGGTYSGPSVNSGVFYPSQLTVGSYSITYSYTDANGCSATASTSINVTAAPAVDMTSLPLTCSSASAITLTGGSPAGGTYSGAGVTGTSFDPATAGVGTHVITYTYTNAGGCTSSATNSITVAAAPNVSLAAQPTVCVNGSMVLLSGGTPGGGTYSGTGVTNGMFDPSVAGTGSHTITYDYVSPEGCTGSATSTITVTGLPMVSVSGPSRVCKNGGLEPLAGSPTGGVFSGPGVQGSDFNPSIVAPGTYTVTYTYTDGSGCSNSSTTDVVVDPLPAAPLITQNGCVLTATSSITNANYSWFDQSGTLVGSGATLTTPCVGLNVYTVEGQDPATGCSSTSSEFVASYVGLDEELTAELIEVFPNPNRGEFTLSIEQISASNVTVVITDARGRVILEEEVDHNNGASFEKSFNLEQVESGVYFIRVSADGHSTVKRIVIEK